MKYWLYFYLFAFLLGFLNQKIQKLQIYFSKKDIISYSLIKHLFLFLNIIF